MSTSYTLILLKVGCMDGWVDAKVVLSTAFCTKIFFDGSKQKVLFEAYFFRFIYSVLGHGQIQFRSQKIYSILELLLLFTFNSVNLFFKSEPFAMCSHWIVNANIIFAINFAEKYETNSSRCFGEKKMELCLFVYLSRFWTKYSRNYFCNHSMDQWLPTTAPGPQGI